MSSKTQTIPWIEKYRPCKFDDIVLDDKNRKIFQYILRTGNFINLLLFGPPGTGKTTTVTTLIDEFKKKHNKPTQTSTWSDEEFASACCVIHLNASDDRGIDVIRNQINQFVSTHSIFRTRYKFVILDEVDYMTKTAQSALKNLIQQTGSKLQVRFCLICNYISRIDPSLVKELNCIHFNQLPKQEIHSLLRNICEKEHMSVSPELLESIIVNYKSDIRSMTNYLQMNQFVDLHMYHKVEETTELFWDILNDETKTGEEVEKEINRMAIDHNLDKPSILLTFFNFIVENKKQHLEKMVAVIEKVTHGLYSIPMTVLIQFLISEFRRIAFVKITSPAGSG